MYLAYELICLKADEMNKGKIMYANAHDIYTQNNIGIESPYKLITMLYEGVLRFNAQAKKAMKDGNIEKRTYWINRSIAVITELIAVLDLKQGNVAYYLDGLYGHQIHSLLQSSIDDDSAKIDEVSKVFKGLLDAWREMTDVA